MAAQPTQPEASTRLWGEVLSSIQQRLGGSQAFETWIRPIVPISLGPELVELEVPSPFFVDWLHQHHLPLLRQALREALDTEPDIRFTARESMSAEVPEASMAVGGAATATLPPSSPPMNGDRSAPDRTWLEGQLHPSLTFARFVVGPSNRLAHAACRAVAERPGVAYNPLFIFGGSGLGKTHLLHAIGNAVLQSRPTARVYYVTAERFTNELIYSIQHAQTQSFRYKYRRVDVLLIDDIQFIAGKESTQDEFFYTFNELRDAHKQVVVTADKPPKDLSFIEDRLTSRFNHGLVTDIQMPDLETRLAILRNRCDQDPEGANVPDDVRLLIADRIRNNIRDLEGCLVRLLALGSLLHQEITVEMAEDVLQHYVNPEPDRLSPERILGVVADRYNVRPDALCGQRRTQSVALPRQVAMYLMRNLTDLSFVEIGRMLGGRDHTTVMYACEKVVQLMKVDTAFSDKVNGLISTLESA